MYTLFLFGFTSLLGYFIGKYSTTDNLEKLKIIREKYDVYLHDNDIEYINQARLKIDNELKDEYSFWWPVVLSDITFELHEENTEKYIKIFL
jgi:hypothetical protein